MSRIPFACLGKPQGQLYSAEEFILRVGTQYQIKGIHPYCPECDQPLLIINVNNPTQPKFYKHNPHLNKNEEERCSLIEGTKNSWICRNFDFIDIEKRKRSFFTRTNIVNAYWFCWHFCRKGNMPFEQFVSLLIKASRRNIWRYANLEAWMIPYILLTLEEFTDNKSGYKFEFIFESNKVIDISMINHLEVYLHKRFADSKKDINTFENPYLVNRNAYIDIIRRYQKEPYISKEFSDKLVNRLSAVDSIRPYLSY